VNVKRAIILGCLSALICTALFAQTTPDTFIEVTTKEAGELYFQGKSVALLWDDDTHRISIDRPGVYTLQLKLLNGLTKTSHVNVATKGGITKIDFSIIPTDNLINTPNSAIAQGSPSPAASSTRESGLWYNSYAPGFRNNKSFLNAGIGLGPTGSYNMGIPPISASMDFKVSDTVPITVGAMAMFSTWKWISGAPPYNYNISYRNIGFGGRVMYHFNFTRNLDSYTGLTLGYVIQSVSGSIGSGVTRPIGNSFFLWGFNIGIRYLFTDRVGIYSELGWSGLQILGVGLSMKM
jgi:hypothetical protein